jgi:molybdopterin biosynthesis enzyme
VAFAGTDIPGRNGASPWRLLTSRDTGVLAAFGVAQVHVWRMPIVAIL